MRRQTWKDREGKLSFPSDVLSCQPWTLSLVVLISGFTFFLLDPIRYLRFHVDGNGEEGSEVARAMAALSAAQNWLGAALKKSEVGYWSVIRLSEDACHHLSVQEAQINSPLVVSVYHRSPSCRQGWNSLRPKGVRRMKT